MMGAYMFTCMLLRPFAAQLLGRYGPLRVMQWLLILHAATLLLFVGFGVEAYLWLRPLQGVATAFFSMTMQAGIVEKLEDKDRAQGLSMYTLLRWCRLWSFPYSLSRSGKMPATSGLLC